MKTVITETWILQSEYCEVPPELLEYTFWDQLADLNWTLIIAQTLVTTIVVTAIVIISFLLFPPKTPQ